MDLKEALAEFERLANEMPEWVGGTMREPDLALFARRVAGEALRRAIAAEAALARIEAACELPDAQEACRVVLEIVGEARRGGG